MKHGRIHSWMSPRITILVEVVILAICVENGEQEKVSGKIKNRL